MEKSLLKVVLCSVITMTLSSSVFSQNNNIEKERAPKMLSFNTIVNKRAKETIEREAREVKAKELKVPKEESSSVVLKKKSTTAKNATFNSKADYITVLDGKAFVKRNGKFLPVKNERMVGELKVKTDGKVIKPDGSEELLMDGQAMTMDGSIVRANETAVLKERMNSMYETCNSLTVSRRKNEEALVMLNHKTMLMDKKMNLVNQKMLLMVEHLNNPRKTQQDVNEYDENIALIDLAIQNTEADIRDIDEMIQKERANN